ncbi:MAG: hypothetical protein HY718_08875 [Planctomycetes bacterium]|nr:hypothetical protein [Planctomycetota bacterium]
MILRLIPEIPVGANVRELERESMIAASRASARRRWIVRTGLMLGVSAIVLVVLVVGRRDRMAIDEAVRAMDRPVAALQAEIDALGQLPARMPEVPSRVAIAYASDLMREYARTATEPVIVASTARRALILQRDGNAVVIYHEGKVRQEWWSRERFINAWQAQEARIKNWEQERRSQPPRLP